MIFEKECITFRILDVIESKHEGGPIDIYNTGRNFGAFSLRMDSDSTIITRSAEYKLSKNCVCYIPARLDYRRITTKDCGIVIHFETNDYTSEAVEYFKSTKPERLEKLFSDILDCWNKKDIGYKYKCSSIFNEILAECYAQNYKPTASKSKIKASAEYLEKNYQRPNLSIAEVASKSFMSEVHFRKLFKQEYGISPRKYLIRLRMQNAALMISVGL